MRNKIYKYPMKEVDVQILELPVSAQILSVQYQDQQLCLWAWIDSEDQSKEERLIHIYGTGNPIPDYKSYNHQHLATIQKNDFVWHVFELEAKQEDINFR